MTVPDAHTHLSCLLHSEGQDFSFPACVCATSLTDWDDLAGLARKSHGEGKIIPSFGIHPWHVNESSAKSMKKLQALIDEFPDAGIGEIGLDHTRNATAALELQQEIFEQQLRLARETDRVISIHCVRAWGRLLDSLEGIHPSRILIHGWKGPIELLPRLLALGCYFSIGLPTLEKESLLALPGTRILVESDDLCGSAQEAADTIISLRGNVTLSTLRENFSSLWRLDCVH